MGNLSRRAKFLSIIAALGSVGGVANAGNNNENRSNIKHEICKSSSIAKELLKGAGWLSVGAGIHALLMRQKSALKKETSTLKEMEDRLINWSKDGRLDIYNLFTDSFTGYKFNLECKDVYGRKFYDYDAKVDVVFKVPGGYIGNLVFKVGENNTVSVSLSESFEEVKKQIFKENTKFEKEIEKGVAECKEIENKINGHRVLKEMILNTLRMEKSFIDAMEGENCPFKFVFLQKNGYVYLSVALKDSNDIENVNKYNSVIKKFNQNLYWDNVLPTNYKLETLKNAKKLRFKLNNNVPTAVICDDSNNELLVINKKDIKHLFYLLDKFSNLNHEFDLELDQELFN